MLSQRHAAERLQTCWHGGGLSLADVRKQMRDALDEFIVAGSGSEVAAVSAQWRLGGGGRLGGALNHQDPPHTPSSVGGALNHQDPPHTPHHTCPIPTPQVLQDLALPHYHHEFVKAAVERLFEQPSKAAQLTGLLRQLSETGLITSTQMAQVRARARVCVCVCVCVCVL
jgi:hypothetical protein